MAEIPSPSKESKPQMKGEIAKLARPHANSKLDFLTNILELLILQLPKLEYERISKLSLSYFNPSLLYHPLQFMCFHYSSLPLQIGDEFIFEFGDERVDRKTNEWRFGK